MRLDYRPDGDVLRTFMKHPAFVRGLRGPIGSGKSVSCAIECIRMSLAQKPWFDTNEQRWVSKTRGVIIRNTHPMLITTVMKTWKEWFPQDQWGKIRMQPPYEHVIRIPSGGANAEDNPDYTIEVLFLAMDRDEDVRKLLSLELTWAWINEARELSRGIVTATVSRLRRYPSLRESPGATRPGLIMDTNAPERDHWWAIMSGEVPPPDDMPSDERLTMIKPDDWEFFTQPPAMTEKMDGDGRLIGYELNPARENGKYIDAKYYDGLVQGQTRAWIMNMVLNRYGSVWQGGVVYPAFRPETHVSRETLMPFEGHPITVGMDFGLTPAAVFTQRVFGRAYILREYCAQDMGARRFAEKMIEIRNQHYPEHEMRWIGDPAGDQRAQTDERTIFQIFREAELRARPAITNDWLRRLGAVEDSLSKMIEGRPAILVDPSCHMIINGFVGGYHYPEGKDRPDKNRYSHPHDALQYAMLDLGFGKGGERAAIKAIPTRPRFKPMAYSGLFGPRFARKP